MLTRKRLSIWGAGSLIGGLLISYISNQFRFDVYQSAAGAIYGVGYPLRSMEVIAGRVVYHEFSFVANVLFWGVIIFAVIFLIHLFLQRRSK